jgi:CPA2 family monovalent cation:H+ antiporter-2
LGAFFAGMVLAESQLSSQAAKETLPLRDAFAVLFFVSVGMLFNPAVLIEQPLAVVATFLIITVGKSIAAFLIVRAFGHPNGVALTISASLAQIGEFSFILIVLAVNLAIVPPEARDLVVAGSIMSILVNPLMFLVIDKLSEPSVTPAPKVIAPAKELPSTIDEKPTTLTGHAVLVGHGRVGSHVAASLLARRIPFVVVDEEASAVTSLRERGVETFIGACGEMGLLDRLNLQGAIYLITAIPDPFEAGHVVEVAKASNPQVRVIARAHSAEAVAYLRKLGADVVLMGEEELARGMSEALVTVV